MTKAKEPPALYHPGSYCNCQELKIDKVETSHHSQKTGRQRKA